MILNQSNPLLRRLSFTVRDVDGILVPGLGSVWSGAESQSSVNGAALIAAAGTVAEIGGGAYYYQASAGDASVAGDFVYKAAKVGYQVTVVDEPINASGYAFIAQNEISDPLRRIYFTVYDPDGNLATGLTFSGAEIQSSLDGSALVNALGSVVAVGSGIYYYQAVDADVASPGDLLVKINKASYQAVVARKLIIFTGLPIISTPQVSNPTPFDLTILGGADIALTNGDFITTPDGDWSLVSGVACAKQSVIREIPANPGSLPRRPFWGAGISGMLFKGLTKATRDRMVASVRARLLKNPRIRRVNHVTVELSDDRLKPIIKFDADSVDGPVSGQLPISAGGGLDFALDGGS